MIAASKSSIFLAVITVVAIWFGYMYANESERATSPEPSDTPPVSMAKEKSELIADSLSKNVSNSSSTGGSQPLEFAESIYSFDLNFRQRAQQAAENAIAQYSPESLTRWRPMRFEPSEFISGDYLDENSIPISFQVTPFPDATFTVFRTKLLVMERTESVIWEGNLGDGTDTKVEMTIVGGAEMPGVILKIIQGTHVFSLVPTDEPNVYVALENNPNLMPTFAN